MLAAADAAARAAADLPFERERERTCMCVCRRACCVRKPQVFISSSRERRRLMVPAHNCRARARAHPYFFALFLFFFASLLRPLLHLPPSTFASISLARVVCFITTNRGFGACSVQRVLATTRALAWRCRRRSTTTRFAARHSCVHAPAGRARPID